MSLTTRNPLRMGGSNVNSGNVNTGEVNWTRGGGQLLCQSGLYSGDAGGGMILVSGIAGRVNSITPHVSILTLSGIANFIYDGNSIQTSGAPFAASGHKILANFNTPYGVSGQFAPAGTPIAVDLPFQSGLMYRAASGAVGISISWTPETNPATGG